MGKSTGRTKLSSFPILLGTSSFLLFKESTVQEGEGWDSSPADLHSNWTCFCRCKWNFAWASNRDCKIQNNSCWSCSQTERWKSQVVDQGTCNFLGSTAQAWREHGCSGVHEVHLTTAEENQLSFRLQRWLSTKEHFIYIRDQCSEKHMGWNWPTKECESGQRWPDNDIEKCVSNEASSPDSKLIPGIKE